MPWSATDSWSREPGETMTPSMTKTIETISHRVDRLTIEIDDSFERFRKRYEQAVPAFQSDRFAALIERDAAWQTILDATAENAPHDFILYWSHDFTSLMRLAGDRGRCVEYLMGLLASAKRRRWSRPSRPDVCAARHNGAMPKSNDTAAALLDEYAELTVMTGGDPFRARVYGKAARAIAAHPQDVSELPAADLLRIPGVGKSIAAKVAEIIATGTFTELEELRADIPDGVRQLTQIPALGPRRALQLYRELEVSTPEQLKTAIAGGQLNDLKGFGPKSADKLLRGIELLESAGSRVLLNVAAETAAAVIDAVGAAAGCLRIGAAGSLRRAAESVGDVDVLAAADDSAPLMAALTAMPESAEVIASGPTKTSVRTSAGLQVDLRVVPLDCWGAALQYFTGSQHHNVRIRELAVRRKLKLSEYGLFDAESGELIVSAPRKRSTRSSGSPGSRRCCARTPVRSLPLAAASCPPWSPRRTSEATCIRTPT